VNIYIYILGGGAGCALRGVLVRHMVSSLVVARLNIDLTSQSDKQ